MIHAKNITKNYGTLTVLNGVDIEIEQGNFVSIVGKSGAGKSTLLHILGTLDRSDSGSVWMDGINISELKGNELSKFRNENIGFVFQFHHLLPEFTAIENVCIPGFISNKDEKKVRARAAELLDYMGLSERISHRPSQMSGGEQQRVAIARALINSPKVVFADEPTGNLDSTTSKELQELFFKLREDHGQTFVVVTHNTELAQISDVIFKMADGRMIQD